MGTIFYGVSGEGRGHSTRARAIVEDLKNQHEIVIYAPALAHDLLASAYHNSDVRVRRLPGFCYYYTTRFRLNYWKTGWHALCDLTALPEAICRLQKDIEKEKPDLVITDFEPILPRAARRCGAPFISLNHQHFLLTYDLSSLPWILQWYAALMAQVVRVYYNGQVQTIGSRVNRQRLCGNPAALEIIRRELKVPLPTSAHSISMAATKEAVP